MGGVRNERNKVQNRKKEIKKMKAEASGKRTKEITF